eukprot:1137503-Pelagomonas_calceolata.AAC.2
MIQELGIKKCKTVRLDECCYVRWVANMLKKEGVSSKACRAIGQYSQCQDKLEKIEKAHVSFISYVWEGNWRTGEQISI